MSTWIVIFVVMVATLAIPARSQQYIPSTEQAAPSDHAKAQVARLHEIKALHDTGRSEDARKRIAEVRSRSRNLATNDPLAADGDEMEVALLAAEGRFSDAKDASDRLVRLRRVGPANEQLLLCWTLLQHAIVLDGTGDVAGADKFLVESIGAARNSFSKGDIRRAQMLEAYADLLARGYNRPLASISLYRAAIELRETLSLGSKTDLAETLRKLAIVEPPLGLDVAADGHLDRAVALLRQVVDEAKDEAARREIMGDIATLLGMQVGLAARAKRFDDARRRLADARNHAIGTPSAPFMDIYEADVDRREAESNGDFSVALAAVRRAITTASRLGTGNDPSLVASLELIEGRLQIELGDLDAGENAIRRALDAFAVSPSPEGTHIAEGWLLLGRIESERRQEVRAKRWVTAALAMLKARRSEVPVLFATNRAPRESTSQLYGTSRSNEVSYGEALVLVPGAPPLQGAGLSTLGGATSLEKLLIADVRRLERDPFAASAQARSNASRIYRKTALLFVHGFGTTFEFAVARAAQISRDIAFDGPTFLFSWPSQGRADLQAYAADEKSANASVEALAQFIRAIPQLSGAERLHIVGHSMGNQVLIQALGKLTSADLASVAVLGEIVFASPDVAEEEFTTGVAKLKGRAMTLYASAYDKALWISSWRNWASRAGSISSGLFSSGRPLLVSGVDSIDVSEAGRDYFSFNHDTYVSSPHVANDLRRLLQTGERPPTRRSADVMVERGSASHSYWVFRGQPQ